MIRFSLLLFLWCGFVVSLASVSAQPPERSGYKAAWFDDFQGDSLDTTLWTPSNTNVPTNNSLQDYLPDLVTVSGGNLVITSENIPSRGLPYRSGLVTSTALQKYGRWDVRAKLPTSMGMWPAIWLLADAAWPSEGEIDIMENRGNEPLMTSSAFHWGSNNPYQHSFLDFSQTMMRNGSDVNFHDGFHTYSVEWDPKQIRFYVDDVHHWTVRDRDVDGFLTNNVGPMRLIINTAVGGEYLQNPDDSTIWPQSFEVDFVHAYHKLETDPVLKFDNGGFEANSGSLAHWRVFGNSINNVSVSNLQAVEGNESLKLYGRFNNEVNYSGIEQGISVKSGDELTASAKAIVLSNDSIAGTGNRVELKIDYYRELYGEFGQEEYISSDWIVLVDGNSVNDQWIEGKVNSIAPEGAVEARLALVFRQQDNAAGAVYIDNVRFSVAIPEPTGVIDFGLIGLLGVR